MTKNQSKNNKVTLSPDRESIMLGDLGIDFMRTLRIPDDGRQHPLPPGLGRFPIRRVEDYADTVPADWLQHGGVFLPMYEEEALWLNFSGNWGKPTALKVLMGTVNAITGEPYQESLNGKPQDYLVSPGQPWLDGIKTEKDSVRQFVAMPLGSGATVEGQITGEEKYGGLQLISYPAKKDKLKAYIEKQNKASRRSLTLGNMSFGTGAAGSAKGASSEALFSDMPDELFALEDSDPDMGLAAGGTMRQEIYVDDYGVDFWDQSSGVRCYVHICNAEQWTAITGEAAPARPHAASQYQGPWFDIDDKHIPHVPGSDKLNEVKSVEELKKDNPKIVMLPPTSSQAEPVGDGDWPTGNKTTGDPFIIHKTPPSDLYPGLYEEGHFYPPNPEGRVN